MNNPDYQRPSRARKLLIDVLSTLAVAVFLVLLAPLALLGSLGKLARATPGALVRLARAIYAGYRAFMHRHVESVGLIGGLAVTVAVSYGLYLLNPNTPSLHEATLQVLAFAPVLLFLTLHATIYTYKNLLPVPFKAFMAEIGEKINAVSLPPLEELLPTRPTYMGASDYNAFTNTEILARAQFKLKYYTLKFTFRCVRYVLFSLPFFAIFLAMKAFVVFALTMQPHS